MSDIPEFDFHYRYFLDHTTNVYGGSGTGKSFIIKDIALSLKPHIDQIIVFNPTDRSNKSYSGSWVPTPCVHYDIKIETILNIWERQTALASVYTRVHTESVIHSLISKLPNARTVLSNIELIKQRQAQYSEELRNSGMDSTAVKTSIDNIAMDSERLIRLIYTKLISDHADYLRSQHLTEAEDFSVRFINLNPRMLIIFDDATDLLAKIKNHPIIQKIFYQCRWVFLTVICAAHTDKAFLPEVKKNCFVSIFTEEVAARGYFERPSNDFGKEARQEGAAAYKSVFKPAGTNQKLIYIRDMKALYRYTAPKHPNVSFIKNSALMAFMEKVAVPAGTIVTEGNRFANAFK